MMTIEAGKVFGTINVDAVSNQSLENLHEEIVLQPRSFSLESKSGQEIILDLHAITIEKDTYSNRASVQFTISYDVDSVEEEAAFREANLKVNEETVIFFNFQLTHYDGTVYSFNVINYSIEFSEFLEI